MQHYSASNNIVDWPDNNKDNAFYFLFLKEKKRKEEKIVL